MLAAVPELLTGSAATADRRPGRSLLAGLAVLILLPFAVMALMLTGIGAPLAILLLLGYLMALIVSIVVAAAWIGRRGRLLLGGQAEPSRWKRFWWLVLGLIIIALLGAIPFVGWFLVLIAALFGFGAFILRAWRQLRQPTPA